MIKAAFKIGLMALLIALCLVAVAIVSVIYQPTPYKALLEDQILKRFGYEVSAGDVNVTLSPTELRFHDVAVRNGTHDGNPELAIIERVAVRIDALRALKRHNPFWSAHLSNAELYLSLDLQTLPRRTPPQRDDAQPAARINISNWLSFREIVVANARVYPDRNRSAKALDFEVLKALRESASSARIEAKGIYGEKLIAMQGTFVLPAPAGSRIRTTLSVEAFGIKAKTVGMLGLEKFSETDLSLSIRGDRLDQIEDLLSTALPDVTPVNLELRLTSPKTSALALVGRGSVNDQPARIEATL